MTLRNRHVLTPLFIGFCLLTIPSTALAEGFCGDGGLDPVTEECDDRNFVNRDGCSAYCKLEDMTPPSVSSVSVPNGSIKVRTTTHSITAIFSEPINPASLNTLNNVLLLHNAVPMEISISLASDKVTLTLKIAKDLFPKSSHALRIKNIKDTAGNIMTTESITVFETDTLIDHTAPNVVVDPSGGTYGFAQNTTLTPYIGEYTGSDEFKDATAKIYYTVDGSIPTEKSTLYTVAIPIRTNTTLKFFAVDSVKNRTHVRSIPYSFDCLDSPNAKKVTPYPTCTTMECEYGFVLRGNACVVSLEGVSADNYVTNAVTAPLFPSATPVTITSKPSIFVTPAHKGILPRPIVFKESKRGTVLQFDRDTSIKDSLGKAFSGYILPPKNLYLKDFPINFGYTFRSIFEFNSAEGKALTFTPPYRMTIPYSDAFNPEEGVTLFTYNPKTETYIPYDKHLYSVDLAKQQVTLTSEKTGAFFIAQSGQNFNRSIFKDITNHWAKNYIEALYRKGVVNGRDEGVFAPDLPLTRAEFIKVALKASGTEVPSPDSIRRAPFRDSPLDSWFTPYLAKAKELGLISGYSDNSFKPGKLINRAEAIKILITAFGFDLTAASPETPTATAKGFKDLLPGQWYFDSIDFALRHKLVNGPLGKNGVALKTFGPDKPITRAELSKLTIKTIELKESLEKTPPLPDAR